MDKGELDLAVGSNIANYWAPRAMYFTKTKLTNFSTMVPLSRNFKHAFYLRRWPMKTWRDQEGRNILVGPKASAAAVLTEEVLKALGMNVKYVTRPPQSLLK